MRRYLSLRRKLKNFTSIATIIAFWAAGLTLVGTKPTFAEFEIQETQVEKGELEFEYRGAVHWGFPRAERAAAGEEGGALEEEEEAEFLRQSHDFEFQWSMTNRWMFSTALSADEPLDQDFDLSSVELELQYEVIEREGNGLGLAFIGAYGFATRSGEADEIEFGPFFELASGNFLFTGNPAFTAQVGENRTTDSLGFEYGWRAQYNFAKKWAGGAEMFGEIEDLSHAGSFNDQQHSIGPTLFYAPGGFGDDDNGNGNGDDERKVGGPPEMELSFNVGVQFGLTDFTSDTALKFQGELQF